MPPLVCEQSTVSSPVGPNPYDVYSTELRRLQIQLTNGCLSTSHVLMDLHRLVNDAILTTATAFLSLQVPTPTPSLSSLTAHPSLSLHLSTLLLQLRDANLLSIADDSHIRLTHSLTAFALSSSLRSVTVSSLLSLLSHIQSWVGHCSTSYTIAMKADLSTFSLARPPLRSGEYALSIIAAVPGDRGKSRPHGWTEAEWALHCQPLWNTAPLDLQKSEDEETEKEVALEEERKERLALATERARVKREKEREKREAARERLKAKKEKADDRAKRLADGDIDADEAKKEEEEEEKERVEGADGEGEEEKEEAIIIPPPVVKHTPLTFCCVACHTTLLIPATIHRVHNNTVWTKPGMKIQSVIRNTGEQWQQMQAEADLGAGAEEEGEEDGEGDVAKKGLKVEDTSAVYCSQCYAYVGRHYTARDLYRLVYIDRLTGHNWMYVTGDLASLSLRLTPLLSTPTTDEAAKEEDEEDEDGEPKPQVVKEEVIPVISGLPTSYVSTAQAIRYPFPRFPPSVIAAMASVVNPNFAVLTASAIATLQAASLDPIYAVEPIAGVRLAGVDVAYTSRLLLSVVTQHLLALFAVFESPTPASPYHPPAACPIPAFTHFYLSPPELTHARGTARYAFHYLTGKDDSKVKRYSWALKKVKEMIGKMECGVLLVMAGGWGGMRAIIVKVGEGYRIYQSNDRVKGQGKGYGLREWVKEGGRWSLVLNGEEMGEWYGKFERARRGEKAMWEELFCKGQEVRTAQDAPQDRFKENECQFSLAKLLPVNIHME